MPAEEVATLAGSSIYGQANGLAGAATFNAPSGLAVHTSSKDLFVADPGNFQVTLPCLLWALLALERAFRCGVRRRVVTRRRPQGSRCARGGLR